MTNYGRVGVFAFVNSLITIIYCVCNLFIVFAIACICNLHFCRNCLPRRSWWR